MFKVSLYNGYNTNSITDYKRLNPEHRVSFVPFSKISFDLFVSIKNKDDEIFKEKMTYDESTNIYSLDLSFNIDDNLYICEISSETSILNMFIFKVCEEEENKEVSINHIVSELKIIKESSKSNNVDFDKLFNKIDNLLKVIGKNKIITSSNSMAINNVKQNLE